MGTDGSVEGIEIDILELICEKLEIELKIEQVDFETIIPGVKAGKFDAGVSGITVDEKMCIRDRRKSGFAECRIIAENISYPVWRSAFMDAIMSAFICLRMNQVLSNL